MRSRFASVVASVLLAATSFLLPGSPVMASTTTNFTIPISQVPGNTPVTSSAITAGTASEFDGVIIIDLPNGLTDWQSNASYAGLAVTLAVQHNEGTGWVDLCSVTNTAPTNHLPELDCQWNPTNSSAQARAQVTFSKSAKAGAHGSITTLP